MRIILLEDDQDQAALMRAWLEQAGHQCAVYDDGKAFIRAFIQESFDMVILDWMVPHADGLEVLKLVRENLDANIPMVFVTQRDAEADIVSALEAGADDYMTKPVRQAEMTARVNVIARRLGVTDESVPDLFQLEPYEINTKLRVVKIDGEEVELTQKEYELVLFLFRNLGKVISRGHLLEMVWGTSAKINTRTIDTHVSRLRNKLRIDDQPQWKLSSVYRHGYRLENIE